MSSKSSKTYRPLKHLFSLIIYLATAAKLNPLQCLVPKSKAINRTALLVLLITFTSLALSSVASAATSDSFRFIAWADTKSGTSTLTSESKVANGLNPDFTIYPGDLCDSGPDAGCFATWKNAFNGGGTNNLLDKSFVTRGNHDSSGGSYWQSAFEFATTANRVGATNYAEQTKDMTYSFDYGNSHFVGIDLPGGDVSSMSSAQITWLDNDLAAAERRGLTHAFLFWHGPFYYVDGHSSTPPATLVTVLNKHPIVSATFHGHEHLVTYTRIDSSRNSGVTHPFEQFVSGAAGAGLYNAQAGRYNYWLSSGGSSKSGFLAVDVSGNHFNISVYNVGGSVDKRFSFSHGASLVSTPKFSPPAGTYSSTQSISISTATSGATIHYTTDGTTPTESSPTYTGPITVPSNRTIKAGAWKTGLNPSAIATATYTIYTPVLTTITVSPSTASIAQGLTQTFTAQPKDQNGKPYPATITWTSGNTTVGTVSQTGVFTALNPGTTKITASNRTVSGTATATIVASASSIAYWKFDEPSGTIAYDSSGKNTGAIFGASRTAGKLGSALQFDGVNDYVSVPDSNTLEGMKEVTVSAWMRSNKATLSSGTGIVSKWSSGVGGVYSLRMWGSGIVASVMNSTGNAHNTPVGWTGYSDLSWHFLTLTYNGSNLRLYVDGKLFSEKTGATGSLETDARNVTIGSTANGYYFNGIIDETKIYNRALSASEVLAQYQAGSSGSQPSFPIRAAFYYPWFPEAWNQQGYNPFTNYNPSLGFYNGSDPTVIRKHIASMQYGNIQAGIASWWGQGSKTDKRIPLLLSGAAGTGFKWVIYHENEGYNNPTVAQIESDLKYIQAHYGNNSNYLKINGRFVVFVYGSDSDNCATVDRWKQANTVNAYIVLDVFRGYTSCAEQPDGWHQYAAASGYDPQPGYSYTINPGFWKKGEAPRLERNLTRWKQNIKNMITSKEPWQLINTFNEWGEGSSVESAVEWQTPSGYGSYLDALHTNGQ